MGVETFFWWMVLAFSGEPVVMPVPFQTQAACMWAAESAEQNIYACIPQPAADIAEYSATWAIGRDDDVCEVPTP